MTPPEGLNDDERVRDLYERYYRRVVRYLVQSFRFSIDDARDLAQDVFVRVYVARGSYRREAETTYIMTTAKRVALNHIRHGHAQIRRAEIESLEDVVEPPARSATQERDLAVSRLQEGITRLSTHHRITLLYYLDGFQYAEIGAMLGIGVDAVRSRLKEARVRLRELLAKEPDGIRWPGERPEDDE